MIKFLLVDAEFSKYKFKKQYEL